MRHIETCRVHVTTPVGREQGHRHGRNSYCLGRYTQAEGKPCDDYGDLDQQWPTEPLPIVALPDVVNQLARRAAELRATADMLDSLALMLHGPISTL